MNLRIQLVYSRRVLGELSGEHKDGIPITLFEAMATGVPVVPTATLMRIQKNGRILV